MAESTLQYLDNDPTKWNGNAITVGKRDALEGKLDEINDIEMIQETDTSGNAIAKEAFKLKMGQEAFIVCKALQVFARDTNNPVLLNEIDFEISALTVGKDTTCEDRGNLIWNRGNANALALAPYGITPLMLTSLKNRIKDFHDSLGKPKAAIGVTGAATIDMDRAFGELDTVLTDLDGMIDLLRFSSATFWEGYQIARKRDDTGVRHQSAQVTLIDKVTKAKLGQGTIVVNPVNVTKKVSKRSIATFFDSETGIGAFSFTGTAKFYKPTTVAGIVIETGNIVRLVIELEAEGI